MYMLCMLLNENLITKVPIRQEVLSIQSWQHSIGAISRCVTLNYFCLSKEQCQYA